MSNFSCLLAERVDLIIEQWMQAVREDRHMKTDDTLSPMAVRDHLPLVLQAIVSILSRTEADDIETLVSASFEHGILRAEQGFEPTEVAREYRLLRSVIFSCLETELMAESSVEVYRVFRLIDLVVDEAVAQSFKSYVDQRLKELKQLQGHVTMANQEINRLVQTSQDTLSHQLADKIRTPLSSIIGYTDLFLRQQKQTPELHSISGQLEYIERALRNGRQILHLINDTTDLLSYEAGQLQLHLLPTHVSSIVNQTLQIMAPEIAEKALPVEFICESTPTQVLTDPWRLQQIVINLLSNAIRYTDSGSVEIRYQELDPQFWSISIKDTGMGIAPNEQARIFEPYYRVDASDSTPDAKSTGLGLAIVLRLVKLLQGEIEVQSELGVGSTFTVRFPIEGPDIGSPK